MPEHTVNSVLNRCIKEIRHCVSLNNCKNVLRVREVLAKQEIRSLPKEVCGYSVLLLSELYNAVFIITVYEYNIMQMS